MVDITNMNRHIPLLFSYSDRIIGMGFTAAISSYGRVLAVEEDGEIWIYGVEPGAIAASGIDPKEALEAFRQSFTTVLRDFAAEVHSFEEFRGSVEAFFGAVNLPNEADWQRAVNAVRAGQIDIPDMRREPAESRRFVQVQEEIATPDGRSYEITGSKIRSSVAA